MYNLFGTCYKVNGQLDARSFHEGDAVFARGLGGLLVAVRASGQQQGFQQVQKAMAQASAQCAVQQGSHMRGVVKRPCADRSMLASG